MTLRIDPVAPRLKWDVLSSAEIERIHEATLTIMEDTGIRFPVAARSRHPREGRLRGGPRHSSSPGCRARS